MPPAAGDGLTAVVSRVARAGGKRLRAGDVRTSLSANTGAAVSFCWRCETPPPRRFVGGTLGFPCLRRFAVGFPSCSLSCGRENDIARCLYFRRGGGLAAGRLDLPTYLFCCSLQTHYLHSCCSSFSQFAGRIGAAFVCLCAFPSWLKHLVSTLPRRTGGTEGWNHSSAPRRAFILQRYFGATATMSGLLTQGTRHATACFLRLHCYLPIPSAFLLHYTASVSLCVLLSSLPSSFLPPLSPSVCCLLTVLMAFLGSCHGVRKMRQRPYACSSLAASGERSVCLLTRLPA